MRTCRYCEVSLEGTHWNRTTCTAKSCQNLLNARRKASTQLAGVRWRAKQDNNLSKRKCRKCGRLVPANGKYWQLCSEQCRVNELRQQDRFDDGYIYCPIVTEFNVAEFCGI